MVLFQVLSGSPQGLIVSTQRATTIATDKTGGVVAGPKVSDSLNDR